MVAVKDVVKTIRKCVDYGCIWHLDKYENGCGKFAELQTCIDRNGRMTREEAIKKD